jgi:hypothetical protein
MSEQKYAVGVMREATQALVALLTARANDIELDVAEVLGDLGRDVVVSLAVEQMASLLDLYPAQLQAAYLRTWGASAAAATFTPDRDGRE